MLKRILVILATLLISCTSGQISNDKPLVYVSILPQKYFVERVGGELIEVNVLVGPGQSPTDYEPTPSQMIGLDKADIFFRIGVPFERAWLNRIKEISPELKIRDTSKGIEKRTLNDHSHSDENLSNKGDNNENKEENEDPHIWLSPELVKIQSAIIEEELSATYPEHSAVFKENLKKFLDDLNQLQEKINSALKGLENRTFLVFHPSWGYFAEEFKLNQIAIEANGKDPNQKELGRIIDLAEENGIRTIFVQRQFSTINAEIIAEETEGNIIYIDPLAENYIENLLSIAETIKNESTNNKNE